MFGSERIIGLDIGAATIKLGEFTRSQAGGLKMHNMAFASFASESENEDGRIEAITIALRQVLRERGIKAKSCIFSVSGQSVFTRFVKLPPVDESKIAQIVFYEAQQNVPFPIDEVVWDYQLIGDSAKEQQDVVLLAIKSNIIEELSRSVEAAGLVTVMVDVAPMAAFNAVRYNYGDPEKCIVLLDIGARTTNLLFIEKNKIFSRSIPIAGNAITQSIAAEFNMPFAEAEKMKKELGMVALGGAYEYPDDETQARLSKIIRNVMTRLHAEVARSINFYRTQQGGTAPSKLLLAGGSSILPYTDRFFQEKVRVATEYFNPFRNVDIDNSITRDQLADYAHFFGEVVGLGLRKFAVCPIEVNLLPKSMRKRQDAARKRPYLVGAAVASLFLPLCWWGYTVQSVGGKKDQIEVLESEIKKLTEFKNQVQTAQSQFDAHQTKVNKLVALIYPRYLWIPILQLLNENLETVTDDIQITSLAPVFSETPVSIPVPDPSEGKRAPSGPKSGLSGSIRAIMVAGTIRMDQEPYDPAEVLSKYKRWLASLQQIPAFKGGEIKEVETISVLPTGKKNTFVIELPLVTPIPIERS